MASPRRPELSCTTGKPIRQDVVKRRRHHAAPPARLQAFRYYMTAPAASHLMLRHGTFMTANRTVPRGTRPQPAEAVTGSRLAG
jgi:hypothetical protein